MDVGALVTWRVRRVDGVAATVAATATMAAAVVGALLAVPFGPAAALSAHVYEDVVLAAVWSLLGALLVRNAAPPPFGWLFIAVGASHGLAVLGGQYSLTAATQDWPLALAGAWFAGWIWVPGMFVPLTVLLVLFPDGVVPSPRWRPVVWISAGAMGLLAFSIAVADRVQLGPETDTANPIAVPGTTWLFPVAFVVLAGSMIASAAALVRRLHRSEGERRQQLAPVTAAAVVAIVVTGPATALGAWGPALQLLALPLLPLAAALAVLRYRLFDVEVVVRRSVVLTGLTVLVVGGYVALVHVFSFFLQRQVGLSESLVATGIVALAFQPARSWLQTVAHRSLYGQRDAPLDALTRIGQRMSTAVDPVDALDEAVAALRTALRVPWVGTYDADGDVLGESGQQPRWLTPAQISEVPLIHLGRTVGHLRVGARSPAERLSRADRRLLGQISVAIGSAVASYRFVEDLRRSREHLVLAREEERRRLRRELHDSVGAALGAVSMHADVVALRLDRDPSGAAQILARLKDTAAGAMLDVRRMVDGLRPPSLDELGLPGALAELCAGRAHGSTAVVLDAEPLPALPAAVEVAAYRIAGEAIANALRHAKASKVDVRLRVANRGIEMTISDDGIGIPQGMLTDPQGPRTGGIGLDSMRERAAEVGGALHIETAAGLGRAAGGTTVHVLLPLDLGTQP